MFREFGGVVSSIPSRKATPEFCRGRASEHIDLEVSGQIPDSYPAIPISDVFPSHADPLPHDSRIDSAQYILSGEGNGNGSILRNQQKAFKKVHRYAGTTAYRSEHGHHSIRAEWNLRRLQRKSIAVWLLTALEVSKVVDDLDGIDDPEVRKSFENIVAAERILQNLSDLPNALRERLSAALTEEKNARGGVAA